MVICNPVMNGISSHVVCVEADMCDIYLILLYFKNSCSCASMPVEKKRRKRKKQNKPK